MDEKKCPHHSRNALWCDGNPIALNYASDILPGDKANIAYATVYPFCMFMRVIIAQVLVMMWLG
jgi:uncharacterized transporter YbjL